ncbi:glyoxalase-like domain protein [bacterium BMS3Bbin11]|nr:glyoxalase-like domain protein [bacterium BMS3Abin11]GBE46801.1 glyoxalase-like domain protein [bacterium BMS3Bbin11]GMT40615.1 MAG: glyoxalase [bacterium]HDH07990.1 VOC family protein [Gammaproteobacteria bacterium]HDH16147.1 VOC family protein [Gammaproteobacteria bacterium]
MSKDGKINYLEFPAEDLNAAKVFFTTVFNWSFVDYGLEYATFSNAGIKGGFFKSGKNMSTEKGSALVVFYSKDLEAMQAKIENAGGKIIKEIFSFPGGRRFHFSDPNDNEFAVWSDVVA